MEDLGWIETEVTQHKFKKEFQPYVCVNPIQIKFNAAFVRLLEYDGLAWENYVNIWVSPKNKYLGFFFHSDTENPNKRKLTRQNGILAVSSYKLVKTYSWLCKIAHDQDPKKRKFVPKKIDNIYYIDVSNDS